MFLPRQFDFVVGKWMNSTRGKAPKKDSLSWLWMTRWWCQRDNACIVQFSSRYWVKASFFAHVSKPQQLRRFNSSFFTRLARTTTNFLLVHDGTEHTEGWRSRECWLFSKVQSWLWSTRATNRPVWFNPRHRRQCRVNKLPSSSMVLLLFLQHFFSPSSQAINRSRGFNISQSWSIYVLHFFTTGRWLLWLSFFR